MSWALRISQASIYRPGYIRQTLFSAWSSGQWTQLKMIGKSGQQNNAKQTGNDSLQFPSKTERDNARFFCEFQQCPMLKISKNS